MLDSDISIKGALRNPAILFTGIVLLFLARVLNWATADFWYDEIITLGDFVLNAREAPWWYPFRVYPVANNHMLFSYLARLWTAALPFFGMNELYLRLLPILFGIATLAVIAFSWPRWLGRKLAWLTALLFAFSPVFTTFAYQFRGYSLSILLATIALTGTLELACGNRKKGILLTTPTSLLLPLAIPTNATLPAALILFLILRPADSWRARLQRWPAILPMTIATALGSGYYLTIWPQFKKVLDQTAGWDNPWFVLGNLLLALIAHLSIFAVVMLPALLKKWRILSAPGTPTKTDAAALLAACALPIIVMLAILNPAPFPRVFLVFLPVLSFAIILIAKNSTIWSRLNPTFIALAIIFNGFLWETAATALTRKQILAGQHPQNLIQQHYRGHNLSTLCLKIVQSGPNSKQLTILTDSHDYVPFRFYWSLYAPPENVLNGNDHITQTNVTLLTQRGYPVVTIAVSERKAAELFRQAGYNGPFMPGPSIGTRTAYMTGSPPPVK